MIDLMLASADDAPVWMDLLHIEHGWQAIWVAVGLAGQSLFFMRMFLQWLVSERRGASVVPPVFWWCSVCGAALLLSYFIWRRDPVGILGQLFGFLVYLRNLYFIYVKPGQTRVVTGD